MLEQEAGSVKLQERRVQVFRQALHYLQQYRLMHNFNKSTKNPEVQYTVKLDGQPQMMRPRKRDRRTT